MSSDHQAPPHDPEAELAVIGLALDSAWTGPVPDLEPTDFWVPEHRALWAVAAGLNKPIRPVEIPEHLRPLARRAVRAWLPCDTAADTVRRHAAARHAIEAAHQIEAAAMASDVGRAGELAAALAVELDAA